MKVLSYVGYFFVCLYEVFYLSYGKCKYTSGYYISHDND